MVRYLEELRQKFTTDDNHALDRGMPLFPDHQGHVVRKTGVENSLENVLSRLGIAVTDSSGRRRFWRALLSCHGLQVLGKPWAGSVRSANLCQVGFEHRLAVCR